MGVRRQEVLERVAPDRQRLDLNGVPDGGVILASPQNYYCRPSVAGWLGLVKKSVVVVPIHLESDILLLDRLEPAART